MRISGVPMIRAALGKGTEKAIPGFAKYSHPSHGFIRYAVMDGWPCAMYFKNWSRQKKKPPVKSGTRELFRRCICKILFRLRLSVLFCSQHKILMLDVRGVFFHQWLCHSTCRYHMFRLRCVRVICERHEETSPKRFRVIYW